jgi:hypothetical protein
MDLFFGNSSLSPRYTAVLPILSLLVCLLLTGCAVIPRPAPTALPTAIPTVFMVAILPPTPSSGDGPRILSYTLHATVISGSPAVELAWKAVGDHVEIWTYTKGGVGGLYKDDLPVEGAATVVPQPGTLRFAEFRLVARGGDTYITQTLDTQALQYEMPCVPAWFADISNVCPLGPPVSSRATIQYFEHGRMLWLETPSLPVQTFWIFLDGNRASSTAFQFDAPPRPPEGTLPADESPPPGLYAPQNDFALLWRYAMGPESAPFRDSLGWATTPELGFETLYQCHSPRECELRDFDGDLLITYYVIHSGLYWKEQ